MDKLPKNKQLFSPICWKINSVISPMCQNQNFSRCVMCNMTCQFDWNGMVLGSKDPWVWQYENLMTRSMDLYISIFMHWHVQSDLHMYFYIHPWIHRSLISTDPQILVSLHPWVHRSLDLYISTCLDPGPNICRSSDVSISTSMDPWILWFLDVYMHRSSDPQISVSVHAQICRYSDLLTDLWIFLSVHLQIYGSWIFIFLHPQILAPLHNTFLVLF